MNIVEVIKKNDWYVTKINDTALNLEREIGVFKIDSSFEFFQRIGCNKVYYRTDVFKSLYPQKNFNDLWNYIKELDGTITKIENDFDAIMKDENIQGALGNIRIYRLTYEIKTLTNGKDCADCEC